MKIKSRLVNSSLYGKRRGSKGQIKNKGGKEDMEIKDRVIGEGEDIEYEKLEKEDEEKQAIDR